jgi:hypothetical protein
MKKTVCISVFIFIFVMVSGCSSIDMPDNIVSDVTTDEAFGAVETMKTEFCSVSDGGESLFTIAMSPRKEPDVLLNENADPTKRIEVLGVSYDLVYKESVLFGDTEILADVYVIKNSDEPSMALFDANTGDVLKYHYFPYTQELIAEQDYIAFIESVIGTVPSDYDYQCTTHYYEQGENQIRSRSEKGFIICGENQSLGDYSFYYTKSENGVVLPDHISACFIDGYFLIEKIETGKSIDQYSHITSSTQTIREHLEDQIELHLNNSIDCKFIEILNQSVICQNGEIKLLSNIKVSFTYKNDGEQNIYQVIVQTITEWEA